MPNYGTRTSPWVGAGDMGDTFFQFMTTMSALKNRQAEQANEDAYRQAALAQGAHEFEQTHSQRAPLIGAQVGHFNASTAAENAKTDMAKRAMGNADEASQWAFAREMADAQGAGTPRLPDNYDVTGYNPLKTSMLADTPENRRMLTEAMIAKSATANQVVTPEGAGALQRPMEVNAGNDVIAPSGRTIARGREKPNYHVLSPGASLLEGNRVVASNPVGANASLRDLGAIFNASSRNVEKLGTPDTFGDAPYKSDPALGQMYTNSVEIANSFGNEIKAKLRKQNGVAPHTDADSGDAGDGNELPVGTIHKGYRFKGGDPAVKENWEKVQ